MIRIEHIEILGLIAALPRQHLSLAHRKLLDTRLRCTKCMSGGRTHGRSCSYPLKSIADDTDNRGAGRSEFGFRINTSQERFDRN